MNFRKNKTFITILIITALTIGISVSWFLGAGAEFEPKDNANPITIDQVFDQTFIAQPASSNQIADTLCQTDQIKSAKDIQYKFIDGTDPNHLSLDVYYPADQNCRNWPVMIYVHGGGWREGDKTDFSAEQVKYFTDQGFVVVSANYRLSSQIQYPAYHQDVAAAIAWVVNNIQQYGGNSESLSVAGFSSGADMAALITTDNQFLAEVGVSPQNIRCAILLDAGGYNLTNIIDNNEVYIDVFGTTTEILASASPINYLIANQYLPDFLIITRGNIKRINDATLFYDKLRAGDHSAQLVSADPLLHLEVEKSLGLNSDEIITPTITDFLKNCR